MALIAGSIGALLAGGPASAADDRATRFDREIAPIVERRCQGCHREQGPAPFVLRQEEDLNRRASTLRAAVAEGRMPPWHADGPLGRFVNDRRLAPEEKDALLSWLDAAPIVAPGASIAIDRTGPGNRDVGWRIEPDLVFELPETVDIPAEGDLPYRNFSVPTGFDREVWVTAAEAAPGNPRVVHHMIVDFYDPSGTARSGGDDDDPRTTGSLGSYVPGDDPLRLPPGVARRVPAGAVLVFQMHYTPTGRPERDRSRIGLVLAGEPPQWESRTGLVSNPFIHIPAGAAAVTLAADHTFREEVWLDAMTPHLHLRGKSFEYTAVFPDGRRELLLRVPRWDFDWQTTYRLAQPVLLPAGSRLECQATWDNSAANPRNPDPSKSVSWGEQTSSEMMIGFYQYRPVLPVTPDPSAAALAPAR